jgi:hypothetical protein
VQVKSPKENADGSCVLFANLSLPLQEHVPRTHDEPKVVQLVACSEHRGIRPLRRTRFPAKVPISTATKPPPIVDTQILSGILGEPRIRLALALASKTHMYPIALALQPLSEVYKAV